MNKDLKPISETIIECFKNDGKVLICGNGGSESMVSHFVGEFQGKFEYIRRPLPAISLSNLAVITAIANDLGYQNVFSRQVESLGKEGDILIIISTSGKSKNCIKAALVAKNKKMKVIELPMKGKTVAKIQENQLKYLHEIARKVEKEFI